MQKKNSKRPSNLESLYCPAKNPEDNSSGFWVQSDLVSEDNSSAPDIHVSPPPMGRPPAMSHVKDRRAAAEQRFG